MAAGKLAIGLSNFYVANYANNGTTVTYSSGIQLGRAVSFQVDPEVTDNSGFYADDVLAEDFGSTINTGSFTATIDGLKQATAQKLYALPTVGEDGALHYSKNSAAPYMGLGCVIKRIEEGVLSWAVLILPKVRFTAPSTTANTQGESIEAQTQEIAGTFYVDDTENADWKIVYDGYTTEAAAVAKLKTFLSIA